MHLADAATQTAVRAELRSLGITVDALQRQLLTASWNVHIYEYVAMKRELELRELGPLLQQLEGYLDRRNEAGFLTARSRAAAEAMHDELTRQLGAAGHAWAMTSKDRARVRRREFPTLAIARQPSTRRGVRAFVRAAQKHLMPHVRASLYRIILDAIQRQRAQRLQFQVAEYPAGPRRADAERDLRRETYRGATAEALRLTVRTVRAFYPTFGATTTIQSVKDSQRRRVKRRASA